MKILIDLQGAQGFGSNRGIGKYSMNLSRSLAQDLGKELDLFFLVNFSAKEGLKDLLNEISNFCPAKRVISFFVPKGGNCHNKGWVAQAMINKEVAIDHVSPDFIIHTSIFEPQDTILVPGFDPEDRYKHATILYDLIPFLSPEIYLSSKQKRCWYKESLETLKKSDFIFTISNYTRTKFIESFPFIGSDRVFVIGSATEKR